MTFERAVERPMSRRLAELVPSFGGGPILVHSDVSRVLHAVRPTTNRIELLQRHIALLVDMADSRAVWFPTFNYDFPGTRAFDVRSEPSRVGALSEHARVNWSDWRTPIPIFSICGNGPRPGIIETGTIDPFGAESVFRDLVSRDGTVLFYGAGLHSATILHHAERMAGGPAYRYDKIFPGRVTDATGQQRDVRLNYHVRPLNRVLDYDWPRLMRDLERAGVCRTIQEGTSVAVIAPAHGLVDYWVRRLREDPLYLLDAASREWVEPELDRLGRRFDISDFERQ